MADKKQDADKAKQWDTLFQSSKEHGSCGMSGELYRRDKAMIDEAAKRYKFFKIVELPGAVHFSTTDAKVVLK